MGHVSVDRFRTRFHQGAGRVTERAGGIDDIVDQDTTSAFDIANDVHDFGDAGTLAALVVGRHFQAQYVWGIQGVIGAERDVPRSTIDAIRDNRSDGVPPEDLQIIDFTRQLLRRNRVDEPLAAAVMARLGADEYVQLTTCIGYYAMLAMTVNGVELELDPNHEALEE